jgi:cytoskeletal protein CcmA (bactofilin family)
MKYVSREEFEEHHPRRSQQASTLTAISIGDLTLDADVRVKGIIEGDVQVAPGVQAEIVGVIKGSLNLKPQSTLYFTGVVEGNARIEGNAMIIGVVNGQTSGGVEAQLATGDRSWRAR